MLTLEELEAEWDEDCLIDDMDVDLSAQAVPELHAKYSKYYTQVLRREFKLDQRYKRLTILKERHYGGKMDKDELDKMGWSYKPFAFGEAKPTKTEQKRLIPIDPDLKDITSEIHELGVIKTKLELIIDSIKWRNQTIKNVIDYRKYRDGG